MACLAQHPYQNENDGVLSYDRYSSPGPDKEVVSRCFGVRALAGRFRVDSPTLSRLTL